MTSKISKYQQYHPATIVTVWILVGHTETAVYS